MKYGLRTRLIGTLIGVVVLTAVIIAIAARTTMDGELNRLASSEAGAGSRGLRGYWEQRRESVRLLITQVAIQDAIRRAVAKNDKPALSTALEAIAKQGGLSWLTIVDTNGVTIARSGEGAVGAKEASPLLARALDGEILSTAAVLNPDELKGEGLAAQVDQAIKTDDGTTNGRQTKGLALVAAAPINDENNRTVGAVYGGVLMNHFYDVVDQAQQALGGSTAVLLDDAIVASTLARPDGTRLVDQADVAAHDALAAKRETTGIDTLGGVAYLTHVDPILDDQNTVIGARWFGIPKARFDQIQLKTLQAILIWSFVGLGIALAIGIPVVDRLSQHIARRSKQVRDSARELAVVVVGSEVSGDHVAQTRATVERSGDLIMGLAASADAAERSGTVVSAKSVAETAHTLADLNTEVLSDVIVIDTLAQEMGARMADAKVRVAELSEVARGLDRLVSGADA